MTFTLRIAKLLLLACAGSLALTAAAQDFAGKTIRLVVQFPPGGVPDTLARLIGTKMGEDLKANVIVDNRPGGTGTIAANVVKNAAPDGLTLMLADSSTYSISPFIRQMSFDPVKDFEPVSMAAQSMVVLIANPARAGSVKELIALAKKDPGLAYASSGVGSVHHLAMEMFKSAAGVEMLHVPYKGTSESVPAVVTGDAVAAFAGLNNARAFEKSGKVKILATVMPHRSKLAPETPTFAEAGLQGLKMSVTFGLFAPLKTPRPILDKLSAEIAQIAAAPDFAEKIGQAGLEPASSTPAQMREVIENEQRTFSAAIKKAGIKEE